MRRSERRRWLQSFDLGFRQPIARETLRQPHAQLGAIDVLALQGPPNHGNASTRTLEPRKPTTAASTAKTSASLAVETRDLSERSRLSRSRSPCPSAGAL